LAGTILSNGLGCEPGTVPIGRVTVMFRVCPDCAEPAGFPVGLALFGGPLPAVEQPPD
jgi:hypothetical protein